MKAYIVGLITGAVCTVVPLFYLMHFDRSVRKIISDKPGFSAADLDPGALKMTLASVGTFAGVLVMLISILLIALTGLRQMKKSRQADQPSSVSGGESDELTI
jgi:hypothetical protein